MVYHIRLASWGILLVLKQGATVLTHKVSTGNGCCLALTDYGTRGTGTGELSSTYCRGEDMLTLGLEAGATIGRP